MRCCTEYLRSLALCEWEKSWPRSRDSMMESSLGHADAWSVIQQGRRRRRCWCFSPANYRVSIGITCPTKSLAFTILSSGVTAHNRAVTTSTARNEKTAQCAVFSSHLLPTHQGRRASASTSLALGSRSCLVTANGPMLSIGTATITEEITTITAPIMCVSARPSIDSPP